MTPITETYLIDLVFSATSSISISTQTISDTYVTTGTVYLPFPWASLNPYIVLASLLVIMAVGVSFKKPTVFAIIWIGLLVSGIFFQAGIYTQFTVLLLSALFLIYKTLAMRNNV